MKTILSLALLCFAINAHGATYLLLSQTNAFAKGITNEAKAYTDAHSGGGIVGTVSNNVASAGLLAVDATKTNGIAATKAHITNAWNIFDGDTLKFVNGAGALSAPAGGGNVVNSGASVVGMIPVYTDTTGTAVTPTNRIPLMSTDSLTLSNMTASVVPVVDSTKTLVPSATSTNDLNAIAGKATVLGHYMGTDTNALLAAIGGQPVAAPLTALAANANLYQATNSALLLSSVGFSMDGGGSAISTGKVKGYFTVPYTATISAWNVVCDTASAVAFEVWKVGTGTAAPTVANVIGTNWLSTGTALHSTDLTRFTTTNVTADDIFAFYLKTNTAATEISVTLQLTK